MHTFFFDILYTAVHSSHRNYHCSSNLVILISVVALPMAKRLFQAEFLFRLSTQRSSLDLQHKELSTTISICINNNCIIIANANIFRFLQYFSIDSDGMTVGERQ